MPGVLLPVAELRRPDGAVLRYGDRPGREPALCYLTGLGLAVQGTFARCLAEPALGARRSVLVDVPGAGLSDGPDAAGYALEDHARAVAAVLDHVGLAGVTVVGYSFGGAVAITLAAARPDLVGALLLPEPNLDPGGGFLSRRVAGEAEGEFVARGHAALVVDAVARGRHDAAWAATAEMLRVAAPHGLHRSAVALVRGTMPTMRERLLHLTIPRALVRGARSGPYRGEAALRAAGVHLHTVADAGHGMMWDAPEGFVAAVVAALGDLGR